MSGEVVMSAVVPVHPHPLLAAKENTGWQNLANAYEELRQRIITSGAETLVIYSTTWPSIIGHQLINDPNPKWTLVDDDFHDLGSLPYDFSVDVEFADAWNDANKERGLTSRGINYHGFPIDVGSVVAVSLLNPDNRWPVSIVSSNVYSNRAETIVLAKSCLAAIERTGRKVAVICAMSLSNRMFTEPIEAKDDRIHSLKDDEWNRKILEFLGQGRLEDVAQLSRQIHTQVRVQKVVSFKPMWFLSGVNGQNNNLIGEVLAYEALHGAGGAVVHLLPDPNPSGDKEYDEDDVEYYSGDRDVLAGDGEAQDVGGENPESDDGKHGEEVGEGDSHDRGTVQSSAGAGDGAIAVKGASQYITGGGGGTVERTVMINTDSAPKPVGAYPHARRVGDLLYLSGVGPRQAGSDEIPGGAIKNGSGQSQDYDIKAQTRACIENVKTILEAAGSSLEKVQDITVFLVDMERDFAGYNEIYAEYFTTIGATRTTLAITALPTPIAVEMKVIALS